MPYDATLRDATVREILDQVKREGRTALIAPEGKRVCDAYGIAVPQEGLARSPQEAAELAARLGFPVVLKIVSPEEMKVKGIAKPVVASLAGDVEVEEASDYLYRHGVPAYAYSTEIPVAVLGAKYQWARGAGLL